MMWTSLRMGLPNLIPMLLIALMAAGFTVSQ